LLARRAGASLTVVFIAALAGCAGIEETRAPEGPGSSVAEGRALVSRLLPDGIADRAGWATDVYAAIAALDIAPTPDNLCAAIAIAAQESDLRADPAVPGLSRIAWAEIERRREQAGVPKLVLDAALALPSSNGRSYRERLDAVKTERQLSELFEDFIGKVPFGRTFLADRNPVRTGGPMQVSVAFAESHAASKPYPYPVDDSIRHQVFTRRGGLYFGIAHLLDYPAPYDRMLFRFADFNAGRYASRNAAFQNALTQASGIPLAQDGDLLRYDDGRPASAAGNTELALRVIAHRLDMTGEEIRRDLLLEKEPRFERSPLYARVFDLAQKRSARPLPRAMLPRIELQSPKITRKLTTDWFANRVEVRYRSCLRRVAD
jgi:hypothetical protein